MEPMLAQIILFGGNLAPRGWALCEGQLLPISQYSALFSLLGTTYGGDGRTTFGLPDLRGRVPMGAGNGPGLSARRIGQKAGQETHFLNQQEMPSHSHAVINTATQDQHIKLSKDAAVNQIPAEGDVPAAAQYGSGLSATKVNAFGPATNLVNGQAISGSTGITIGNTGAGQPHNNMQPFITINYIIALQGVFPSRS